MTTAFENLCSVDFDIIKIDAMNQRWTNGAVFSMAHPRPTDALVYFSGCNARLSRGDTDDIYIEKGSICFIPHGDMYTWTFYNEHNGKEISCMLFEFLLRGEDGAIINLAKEAFIISDSRVRLCKGLFSDLINERSRPRISHPRTKAAAFSLISAFSEALRENSVSAKNFGCIYKGIKYLEEDPLQEKTVADIAKMCSVSVNYFERLFKEYAGVTPTKYRLIRKISRSKSMIESMGLSIEQIAEELNFSDSAYFCRCFKKLTGMTPGEYRKSIGNSREL